MLSLYVPVTISLEDVAITVLLETVRNLDRTQQYVIWHLPVIKMPKN